MARCLDARTRSARRARTGLALASVATLVSAPVAALVSAPVAALVSAPVAAADGPLRQDLVARYSGPQVIEKLKVGGNVVLMRHMATVQEPDRWGGVELADCSTQRVLSDLGRQQARELGAAFRALGIPVGEVLVSPYCRTRETAELAFGVPGSETDLLSTWDHLPVEQKTERATELRKRLDTPPAPGTNTVLVTHTGNLLWSLGLDSKPEGLAHVFAPTGLAIARPTYLGRVDPEQWRALAGRAEEPAGGDRAAGSGDGATSGSTGSDAPTAAE